MKIRKTGFSYFTFVISAVIFSVMSVTLIADAIKSLNLLTVSFNSELLNILFYPLTATIVYGLGICFLLLVRLIRVKLIKSYNSRNSVRLLLHVIVFLVILAAGIYFRYLNVKANYYDDSVSSMIKKVFNGEKTGTTATLPYFYLCLNVFVSRFVGIKECVYLWINLVLETLSAILIYFTFKRLFGRIVALGSFAAFMLLSNSYFLVTMNDGYSLLLFMCSFCIYLYSILIVARYKKASYKSGHIVWFVLLGLYSGFLAYMSLYALIIWAFMLSLIFLYRPERTISLTEEDPDEQIEKFGEVINYPDFVHDDGYRKDAGWHTNTNASLTFILSSIIPFIGMIFVDYDKYSLNLFNILWENGYLNILSFNVFNTFIPGRYILEIAVLLIVCSTGLLAIFFHKRDNLSACTLALLLYLILFAFLKNPASAYAFIFIFIGAFWGNAVDFIFFRRPHTSTSLKTSEETLTKKDNDLIFENIALAESINESKENEVKLIENFMAGPKKHVKKEMAFAFEPSEEKMKFDVEITDDDDFDVL